MQGNNSGSGALAPQKEIYENTKGGAIAPLSRHSHLPHIDIDGYYQFVTFRTFDSLDDYVKKIGLSDSPNKEKQQAIDNYLDTSLNGAYLSGKVLDYLFEFLLSKDKDLYELVAFVIMNNHVHILFKPLKNLSKIMQMVKGASAKKINELLGKSGRFWVDDYYDKAIKDERHFFVVYEYIKNNPLKIGGAKAPLPVSLQSNNSESGALVSQKEMCEDTKGEAEVAQPRFYGIFK